MTDQPTEALCPTCGAELETLYVPASREYSGDGWEDCPAQTVALPCSVCQPRGPSRRPMRRLPRI